MKEKGQVVLIIILIMATALGVGLAVVQRSLSDIQSSARVEKSQRAFSAAEAGIERALRTEQSGGVDVGQGRAVVSVTPSLPEANQALEYPPISKEEIAHVWLVDPNTLNRYYHQPYLEIAWGTPNIQNAQERPAIEVTVIYSVAGLYQSKKFYFDSNSARAAINGFDDISAGCSVSTVNTTMGQNREFYCRNSLIMTDLYDVSATLMLLRARILYSSTSQAFAVLPWGGDCGNIACSLPPQARIITSTGTAGETQRKVQLFKLDKVVPFYFDYALFSAGPIEK